MTRNRRALAVALTSVLLAMLAFVGLGGTAGAAAPPKQTARLSVSDDVVRVGTRVVATARFTPVRKGRSVALQQRIGSGWVTVQTKEQSSRGGVRFLLPTVAGSRTYRAVTFAQRSLPTRKTSAVKLRVKAPGTLRVSDAGCRSCGADRPDLSANGRFVVYTTGPSSAPESGRRLVLWDHATGTRKDVTGTAPLASAEQDTDPKISADGRVVTWVAQGGDQLWSWDRVTGVRSMAPGPVSDPAEPRVLLQTPEISGDGRFVTYVEELRTRGAVSLLEESSAKIWDRRTGSVRVMWQRSLQNQAWTEVRTRLASNGAWVAISGLGMEGLPVMWRVADGTSRALPEDVSHVKAISGDGRYVAYADPSYDVHVLDRAKGTSSPVKLSRTYRTWASLSILGLTDNAKYLLVRGYDRDRSGNKKQATFLVARSSGRTWPVRVSGKSKRPAAALGAVVSEDGRYVVFTRNGIVFLRDRG